MASPKETFTAEQIAARDKIAKDFGGDPKWYYGHLYSLLAATEMRIRENKPIKAIDEGYFEHVRDKVLQRINALGLPLDSLDICGYEDDKFDLDHNWRE